MKTTLTIAAFVLLAACHQPAFAYDPYQSQFDADSQSMQAAIAQQNAYRQQLDMDYMRQQQYQMQQQIEDQQRAYQQYEDSQPHIVDSAYGSSFRGR